MTEKQQNFLFEIECLGTMTKAALQFIGHYSISRYCNIITLLKTLDQSGFKWLDV